MSDRVLAPAGRLRTRDWMRVPATATVMDALAGRGAQSSGALARFVGGCVRDAALERPVGDIDIAAALTPDQVTEALKPTGARVIPTGLAHGTVTAVLDGRSFEITTLRRDVETFGRHARVAFTDDWRADAERRDFTFNALYADPDGTFYDPFGGLADLFAGHVRFVGEPARRIEEDALRLLRFFRFFAHVGAPPVDQASFAACRDARAALDNLAGERLAAETLKLMAAPDPLAAVSLMGEAGVLKVLLHLDDAVAEAASAPLAKLIAIEQRLGRRDPLRRFAVLALGAPDWQAVAERFRLSNAQMKRLEQWQRPVALADDPRRALYRDGHDIYIDRLLFAWAHAAATDDAGFAERLAEAEAWQPKTLPINGDDLAALGVAPGPELGRLLKCAEDRWLDSDMTASREALLAHIGEKPAG